MYIGKSTKLYIRLLDISCGNQLLNSIARVMHCISYTSYQMKINWIRILMIMFCQVSKDFSRIVFGIFLLYLHLRQTFFLAFSHIFLKSYEHIPGFCMDFIYFLTHFFFRNLSTVCKHSIIL